MMIKALRAAVLIGAAALGWFARSVFDDLRTSAADIGAYLDDVAGPLTEPPAETSAQLAAFEAQYAERVRNPVLRFGPGGDVQMGDGVPEPFGFESWRNARRRPKGPAL